MPAPADLQATNDLELVSVLLTMDFPTPDDALSVLSGDGIAGRRGYWRFLPSAPGEKYNLKQVLRHGTRADLAAVPGAYRVQAYMNACMHNYRLLVENLRHGTSVRTERCGYLWLLKRVDGGAAPVVMGAAERAAWLAHGSHNTAMVAGMVALGFEPYNFAAPDLAGVDHGRMMRTWYLPGVSADGKWERAAVMALWNDVAWCSRGDNESPVAAMSDCMWNLKYLRDTAKGAAAYVRARNGGRSVYLRADASQETWDKAEQFLY